MVTFISSPLCVPAAVPLPGQTTVRYRVRSSLAAEMTQVQYDLDPNGSVIFAGDGHTLHAAPRQATAAGIMFSDVLALDGPAAPGTIVTIVVTITGTNGVPQVAPAFVTIL
jgi:hypothetical protein